jgi:two-component system response regulator NreC
MIGGSDPAAAGGSGPITIVLAEDHRVVRAGLRMLLERYPDLTVIGETGSVAETEQSTLALRPRVLVLDIDMPDGSSVPAIPRILHSAPETRIVILTMHTDPGLAREALRAGAAAYVLKESAESELLDAIRGAAAGRTYLTPELGAALAAAVPEGSQRRPDDLSVRELEVLELIALGHTNGEIASRLYLSVRTVESHRAHIQQKTRRSSRAELVAYARERNII